MIEQRSDLMRRLGQLTPENTPAYDALVDITQGAAHAVWPAELVLACRTLYAWRRDILGHDDNYLAVYRRALAVVCAAEAMEAR